MNSGRLDPSAVGRLLQGTPLRTPFLASRAGSSGLDQSELSLLDLNKLQTDDPDNPELTSAAALGVYENPTGAPIRDELKYSNFNNVPLSIGAASVRVLVKPQTNTRRTYLFIVNTHATQSLFVAFGQDATTLIGVPILGNFGFFEFNSVVPQDDVFLIGSGAATTGVLLYANDSIASASV